MKKSFIKKLEEILKCDLNNFENMSLSDELKAKSLQSIGKEFAIISAYDKENFDKKNREAQNELERDKLGMELKKFEYEKNLKLAQFKLDEDKFALEKWKVHMELENNQIQTKLAAEKLQNDLSMSKIQIILSITGIISTFLLGLVGKILYANLAYRAQKHEYGDYQLEPNSSKENRQNLLK